jgi:putative transposase
MRYSSDLSDAEWAIIAYCFPKPAATGRPRKHPYRELLNALYYLLRNAVHWRDLPKDFPPWTTVYTYFRRWLANGLIEVIHTHLREHLRRLAERRRQPTAGALDSQTAKGSETCGDSGYDAAKKIKGRKRHIVVDTLGLLLLVMVLPANLQDRDAARPLLAKTFAAHPSLRCLWADGGYAGTLGAWVQRVSRCFLSLVRRPAATRGFTLLPRRWVVERTFAWLGRYRRLNRDYERRADVAEGMVYLAMTSLMLRRWVK